MAFDLSKYLVIGISSRALFDLTEEDRIFREEGLNAFRAYQIDNEDKILDLGTGFPLIKGILNMNKETDIKRTTEVIIMSRNSSETSMRIFNSIEHYGLDISRAVLSGGAPLAKYLQAFEVDLFLSFDEGDVQTAINANIASALLYHHPENLLDDIEQIRIAFDGDAVLFSADSERIYREQGLQAFVEHERLNARKPLPDGPFAKLLKTVNFLQRSYRNAGKEPPIRTALITARNAPSHERVIRTLRAWDVIIDESFFMGGVAKKEVLRAFQPHIFFDDQPVHCEPASSIVPTGLVPYRTSSPITEYVGNASDINV